LLENFQMAHAPVSNGALKGKGRKLEQQYAEESLQGRGGTSGNFTSGQDRCRCDRGSDGGRRYRSSCSQEIRGLSFDGARLWGWRSGGDLATGTSRRSAHQRVRRRGFLRHGAGSGAGGPRRVLLPTGGHSRQRVRKQGYCQRQGQKFGRARQPSSLNTSMTRIAQELPNSHR